MRILFLIAILLVFFINLSAQENFIQSKEGDSVNMYFDYNYLLVKDSCADIIRFGRYDAKLRKFKGPFKDVSKTNSNQIVALGSYSRTGLKEGPFLIYYPDGKLKAKGNFKDNKFDGKWELFYPSGDPKLIFIGSDSVIQIKEAWDEKGKRIVNNGHGYYEFSFGALIWSGKLVGGAPDGKWVASPNNFPDQVIITEWFKLGEFQNGRYQTISGRQNELSKMLVSGDWSGLEKREYKDKSVINLVPPNLLRLTEAENLRTSVNPCYGQVKKIFVAARFKTPQLGQKVSEHLNDIMNRKKLLEISQSMELSGKILEDGRIDFYETKGDLWNIASSLTSSLRRYYFFEPARLDGQYIPQSITISIELNNGSRTVRYKLMPVTTN